MPPKEGPSRGGDHGSADGESPSAKPSDLRSVAKNSLVFEVLLVGAVGAAQMCGLSERTWRKLDSQGLLPRAIHVGRRRLWAVDDLRRWSSLGCPSREVFEEQKRKGRLP